MNDTKTLTFGERMVGLTFNPSGDAGVITTKKYYAQIIDDMHGLQLGEISPVAKSFYETAITQAIIGAMCAVKAITWKD